MRRGKDRIGRRGADRVLVPMRRFLALANGGQSACIEAGDLRARPRRRDRPAASGSRPRQRQPARAQQTFGVVSAAIDVIGIDRHMLASEFGRLRKLALRSRLSRLAEQAAVRQSTGTRDRSPDSASGTSAASAGSLPNAVASLPVKRLSSSCPSCACSEASASATPPLSGASSCASLRSVSAQSKRSSCQAVIANDETRREARLRDRDQRGQKLERLAASP